jgi:bacillolysin
MQGNCSSSFAADRARRLVFMFILPLLPACASENALLRANGGCPPGAGQQSAVPKYVAPALVYLKTNPGKHGVTQPSKQLTFLCESIDELRQKHARFQQSYEGIPVWGQQLIVHFNAQDQVSSTSGGIQPVPGNVATKPKLDKAIASAKAASAAGEGWKARDSTLYLYAHKGAMRLAHLVNVAKGLQRAMVFVDADTGAVLNQISASPNTN